MKNKEFRKIQASSGEKFFYTWPFSAQNIAEFMNFQLLHHI